MNDCKNCNYTDEFCLSGDCPNDKTLNEQWFEGTLQRDKYYYAKDSSEGDCIVHINNSNELTFTGWEVPYEPDQSDKLEPFKLRTKLLAEVPSYDTWKKFVDANTSLFDAVKMLEKDNFRLEKQNRELKETVEALESELKEVCDVLIRKCPEMKEWVMMNWKNLYEVDND